MKLYEFVFNLIADDFQMRIATLSVISYDYSHALNSIEGSPAFPELFYEYSGNCICTSIKLICDDSDKDFDRSKIDYNVKLIKLYGGN